MTIISLPNVGTLTLGITNFLTANPALLQHLGSDALTHALRGYVKRVRKRRGVSRRVMRKTANRKRRWFVDNIIMHHKRLHDRNRAIVVSNARTRALAKRQIRQESDEGMSGLQVLQNQREKSYHDSSQSFRDRVDSLRGRVDARKLRARSRWLSVMGETNS